MLQIVHAEGPPHCRDMVQQGWLVGYPDETNSAILTSDRKLLVSLKSLFFEVTLQHCVSQVSWDDSGFLADLEKAYEYRGEVAQN